MKTFVTLILLLASGIMLQAQNITGTWHGLLNVQGTQLRLVFHINKVATGYVSTMDSPDQGAEGIEMSSTLFDEAQLSITFKPGNIEYVGKLGTDSVVTGFFKQNGRSFPLNLSRQPVEELKINRPQEPLTPFSYYTEEVKFSNSNAGANLAGTLSLPKKKGIFPVVILISGSGPQDRNEEIFGHKPFLVLADHLTKNGIAVLRYDDRGIAASTGDFRSATSSDFAGDVEAAIAFLKTRKEIRKNKIGLIGHSEGGLIAPMVAIRSKDVAFVVMLAGTGIPGADVLLLQQKLIGTANGFALEELNKVDSVNRKAFNIVKAAKDTSELKTKLKVFFQTELVTNTGFEIPDELTEEEFINARVNELTNPWMYNFIKYDPALALTKLRCPVLALNGSKDLQVTPKENLTAIRNALTKAGNKNFTIKELATLNHLFQESVTGSPAEYADIEQTFSPIALVEILNWINIQVR